MNLLPTPTLTVNGSPPRPAGTEPTRTRPWRVVLVTDFYREDMLAGVVSFAAGAGWELNADMRHHGRFPAMDGVDGVLATVTGPRVQAWLAAHAGVPTVRMLCNWLELPLPTVVADYVTAGREGAEHLLGLGHVHFAFYCEHRGPETMQALAGVEAVLQGARRECQVLDLSQAHPARDLPAIQPPERHDWLVGQLTALPRPLAVMCDDDRRALELLAACESAGRRVPEDVAVLGCDNQWVAQGMSPVPLSSVDMNFTGVGRRAAQLLADWMRDGTLPPPLTSVAPLGVLARRSTATLVTDSPGITAAVGYLRQHFREPIRLAELARLAGLSERAFESEFKRRLGRSARAEIQRVRLACVARLLRDTDLKLAAIAAESGFRSASKLCHAFAEAHGVSPNVWRQRAQGRG